ncbi:transposase [Acidovorax sp. 56]|uniref:IS110 family transposase n=1 Tax=Acidovorax sp. 56 TaxID=2035205 RepID=UPI000C16D66B|nr:IS110 family transposase [Acidovorax sp. 56]PIF25255.1 transposase [Acidovorax sp. 56]PIF26609.1 transposase [Acidovorax sp. 56]PIF28461.1 transposase [Acidovorax sp. 56]PIF29319.1 transposase [Acidovorax sp. 56]
MNPQQATEFVGVDVASAHLDVAAQGQASVRRFANTPQGIALLLRTLRPASVLALESTGRYHVPLALAAHAAGLRVYVLNPLDARRYAQSVGQRGKTDRMDALVLARYICHEHAHLQQWQPPTACQAVLRELLAHRATLVRQRSALAQAGCHSKTLARLDEPVLAALQQAIKHVDGQIETTLRADLSSHQAFEHITSVPGLGLVCGALLVMLFGRMQGGSADAVIAFTGLDPRPNDSGKKTGQRRLSKRGWPEIRRLMYAAAMSAARTKTWNGYYCAQRDKGLSTTAALVVLARKLLRVAFSLFKQQALFDPALVAGRA